MENLKIIKVGGAIALEQDIGDCQGPLLVIEKDGGLQLVDAAAAEDRLLGAFVRTPDGWDLAAADVREPVRSGPKAAGSLPLVAGVPLTLGGYAFVLESQRAASANVLLWRVGKSPVVADAVMPGRNVVGIDQMSGQECLNPALVKEMRFEFFLAGDGIETVASDGTHLSVPRRVRFACGEFEGMVLDSAEAAAAIKTRDPFGYPARTIRQALLFALAGVAAVLFFAASFHRQARRLEREAADKPGAEIVAGKPLDIGMPQFGDSYVFQLSVLRDMNRILGPKSTHEAVDLIARAKTLKPDENVNRTVTFLRRVTEIQDLANANRWDELQGVLAQVDEKTFVAFDALPFLKDARELSSLLCQDLPHEIRRVLFGDAMGRAGVVADAKASCAQFKDNVFFRSEAVSGYMARIVRRFDTAQEMAQARDEMTAAKDYTVEMVDKVRSLLTQLDADFREADYRSVVDELRRQIAEWTTSEVTSVLSAYRSGESVPNVSFVRVTPLCILAEDAGVDAESVAEWRKTAREIDRNLDQRYREIYQQYRLAGTMDNATALRMVDEMLVIGGTGGRFRKWALREKARLVKEMEAE